MSKLFVGGLNFQTGAETLGKLFETVGTVKAATIITNDGVSLGRGTVEMETEEAAQQAINKLNGCELEGRRIRVEFEGRPTTRGRGRGRGRGGFSGRGSGGFRGRGGGGGFAPRGRFGGRWGGGGGGGGGFGRNIGYGGYGGFSVGFGRGRGGYRVGGGFGGFNARPFRRFGGEGFRGRGRGRGRGRFGGRGGRFRTPFDPNTPLSKTRVYINNLPFNLNDEGLQKVFTEKGLHVKEVSLGKRRFSTDRNVGFGFVEFETEEEQQRVLREFVNIDIDGRPCTIFAARPPPPKENQESTSGWSR